MIFKIKTENYPYLFIVNTALIPLMYLSKRGEDDYTLYLKGLPQSETIREYYIDFKASKNPEFMKYMEE